MSVMSAMSFAITDSQVFAYAEANFPSVFTGTATTGQYQQYHYAYYPSSRNYLAVDTAGTIFITGPFTNNVLTSVGLVSAYANAITAWEATLTPSTGTACTTGSTSMSYAGTATGSYTTGTRICFTGSSSSLSFSGKTLTNPTINTTIQLPYTISTFTDSAGGYRYEVVFNSGALYEINVMAVANSTFYGQFAP